MQNIFCNNTEINVSIRKYLEKELGEYNRISFAYAIMNKKDQTKFAVISNITA
ncbi:MAG: hypothetical protein ACR5LC_03960 [Symbiopectobacterium sp.]|uniref:hypothetical protein n=1 Tax=Symbiopectobacterium sp. TaxID=2952789 RepID=UPI003F3C99C6